MSTVSMKHPLKVMTTPKNDLTRIEVAGDEVTVKIISDFSVYTPEEAETLALHLTTAARRARSIKTMLTSEMSK